MALNFPDSPSLNDTYSIDGKTWIWNGYGWKLQTTLAVSTSANAAFIQANSSFDHANAAFEAANNATDTYVRAHANAAFDAANTNATSITDLQGVDTTQNTNITVANNHAWSAFYHANAAFDAANNATDTYVRNHANAAFGHANAAFDAANTAAGNNTELQFNDGGSFGSSSNLTYTDSSNVLKLSSVNPDSTAGPILDLYRNSASPTTGDYIGQIQYSGENSTGGTEIYAKVTGKITDATSGSEDGLIETAIKGAGSFTIVSRQKSDELLLLNGTDLNIDDGELIVKAVNIPERLNIAFSHANSAFDFANTISGGSAIDNVARALANSASSTNITQNNSIAASFNHANAAFEAANTSGGTSVYVSDVPPSSPTDNTLWWQSNTGSFKIYYNDGDSTQWVEAVAIPSSLADQYARDTSNSALTAATSALASTIALSIALG